jgi:hypothetical protein
VKEQKARGVQFPGLFAKSGVLRWQRTAILLERFTARKCAQEIGWTTTWAGVDVRPAFRNSARTASAGRPENRQYAPGHECDGVVENRRAPNPSNKTGAA